MTAEQGQAGRSRRIGIFVDGANTYSATYRLNVEIDYQEVLNYWEMQGQLVHAFYYTAIKEQEDGGRNPVKDLATFLSYNGYRVITKSVKTFTDTDGTLTIKGNMDIELAIDMLRMSIAGHIDHAILFSGDGDFRRLVEAVQDEGVRVTVVSTIKTRPTTCADELRRQADIFLEIADTPEICRARRNRHQQHKEEPRDESV